MQYGFLGDEDKKRLQELEKNLSSSVKKGEFSLTELLNRVRKKTTNAELNSELVSKINFEDFLGWFDSLTYLQSLNTNSGEKDSKLSSRVASSVISFLGFADEQEIGTIVPWIAQLNNISIESKRDTNFGLEAPRS